ncbi:hypothetical protein SAMN05444266_102488 [Chitinophaga jiangningensis]|uniref:DUF4374 domain-containing protein n=1 Tax=Chitinophaga jiangningensis TaxID=1419482 RepID=A0A1M6YUI2_9BACT|nr:hypothetical protein [Chitinophaga jiangningensis]SHL21753.1 hypothetical protein SAMN05444266_102488 [Chitinophaga jiangningensis]
MKHTCYALLLLLSATVVSCSKNENAASPAPASSPTKPATEASIITYTDESAFVNSLSGYGYKTPDQLNLNRVGTTSGYNTVYGFNIPAANQVMGFKWNSGDEGTEEWRPQGIAGFTWGTRKFLLVTWYGVDPGTIAGINNQHKGVRIALVDITNMSNITYRHILLVQNKANMTNTSLYKASNAYTQLGSFCPVTIHAGGVTYYAGKIYVADTNLGMRVFDLSKFVSAEADATETRCGAETTGELKAFNYAYILPQSGYYKITNAKPFSAIELGDGATTSQKMLWTCQYITADETPTPQVFGFPVDAAGAVSTTTQPVIITPIDNTNGNVYGMQGVYHMVGKTFMATTGNSSYEGSTARLVRFNEGAAAGVRYRWPHGAEDFYYDAATGYLWNLTEYETSKYGQDNRTVFCVRVSDYD